MSRTTRKVNVNTARWAASQPKRKKAMLLKGAKHHPHDKCMEATTDAEGNHKLNTWSECPGKKGSWANRSIRNAGKLQARRQLQEME